jgi:hypothetical protein
VKRKRAWIVAAVAAAVLAGVGYWWFHTYLQVYYGYTPLPFSKEAWASADAETRGHMVKDLLNRRLLDGKPAAEIVELLGAPDEQSANQATGRVGSMDYELGYMGYNRNAGMVFPYHLLLDFDDDGTLKQAVIND